MAESVTKNGFTITPSSGSGNATLTITGPVRTGRVDRDAVSFTATMDNFPSVSKSFSVVQKGKAEFVSITGGATASVKKEGQTVTLYGKSNSSKLTFASSSTSAVVSSSYTANGASATNGTAITGDPGASAEYDFSVTVTVAVNETSSSKSYTITATANNGSKVTWTLTQTASEFTYSLVLAASTSMISAAGGSSTITGTYYTYRNGVQISSTNVTPTCSIPTGTAFTLSNNVVSVASRGTTVGDTRSVVVSASYGNASNTITVSQQANAATSITYGTPTVTLKVSDIPASGGTISSGTVTYSQSRTQNYTSGATSALSALTSEGTVTYSTAVTASSLGTTVKDRTKVGTLTATVAMNSKSGSGSADVYQQANAATSITYGTPTVTLKVSDIPASGGTISSGTVTYSQSRTQNYTSGATSALSALTSEGTVTYSTAVTASSLGTTVKDRTKVGTLTATVAMNSKSGSGSADVYQQANAATFGEISIVATTPVSISAAGGTYTISPTLSQKVSFTSGDSREGTVSATYAAKNTVTGFSSEDNVVTVQQNLQPYARGGFIVTISASGEGSKTASKEITFNQLAAAAYVNVTPESIEFAADGSSSTITISSNDSWTIS